MNMLTRMKRRLGEAGCYVYSGDTGPDCTKHTWLS